MRTAIMIGSLAAAGIAAFAGAQAIKPGMWQTTSTVTSVDMPGAPPQVAAMMKGHPTTIKHCVTPEEAAKDPRALMRTNTSCKVQAFSMTGGKLNSTMVCRQAGGTLTVNTVGTYTPIGYTATAHMVMTGAGAMTMTANVSSKLIGACS